MTARFRAWWSRLVEKSGVGLGMCLMGFAALVSTVGWFTTSVIANSDRSSLEQQLDCRYDLSAEVTYLESLRDAAGWNGLLSAAQGDEAAVVAQADVVDEINTQLVPARERRLEAVAACKR